VSGGETIDLALKMAFAATKRRKVISAKKGYHGVTGKEIQEIIAPYKDKLENREFFLSVHVDIYKDTDVESMLNEYEENGINRVIFDLSRGDIKPKERMIYLERLGDFIKNIKRKNSV